MANSLDAATLLSIAKNRSRLLKLAEGIKTRKKSSHKKSLNLKRDPAYTNIEHLVFGTYRPRSSTPVSGKLAEQSRKVESEQDGEGPRERFALELPPHQCECQKHSPHKRPPDGSFGGGSDRVSSRQPVAETIDDRYFDRSISSVIPGGSPSLKRADDRSDPYITSKTDLSGVSASVTGFPPVINGLNTSAAVFLNGISRAPLATDELQHCDSERWPDDCVFAVAPAAVTIPYDCNAADLVLHSRPIDGERCEASVRENGQEISTYSAPCGGDENDAYVEEPQRGSRIERAARVCDGHVAMNNACDKRVALLQSSPQQTRHEVSVNLGTQDLRGRMYGCHGSPFSTGSSIAQLNGTNSIMEIEGGIGRSGCRPTPTSRDSSSRTNSERAEDTTKERSCKMGFGGAADCLSLDNEHLSSVDKAVSNRRNGSKNHVPLLSNGRGVRTDPDRTEQSRSSSRNGGDYDSRSDRSRPYTLGHARTRGDTSVMMDAVHSLRNGVSQQVNQRKNKLSPASPRGQNDKISFQRQKSYPSGIPRPKIHMKNALVPTRSSPFPNSTQSVADQDQYYRIPEDERNDCGTDYNSVTAAWTEGEAVTTNSPSSAFVPFRKAASLSEKSKVRPVNIPIIRNSVPVKKLEAETKITNAGIQRMSTSVDRRHVPTSSEAGAPNRAGKMHSQQNGSAGRWSVRATSADRNSHFKKSASRTSFCVSNLADSKTNCSSRSSLSSSRSSLNGSRSNLTCPLPVPSQSRVQSRGKLANNGQSSSPSEKSTSHYAIPTGIPVIQNGRPHIPEKGHPVSRIPATNSRGGLHRVRPVQTSKEAKEMQREMQELKVLGSCRDPANDAGKSKYRKQKMKVETDQKHSYSIDKNHIFRPSNAFFPSPCNGSVEWSPVNFSKENNTSHTSNNSCQSRGNHPPPVRSISLDSAILSDASHHNNQESDLDNSPEDKVENNLGNEVPNSNNEQLLIEDHTPIEVFGGDILEESLRTLEALSVNARQSHRRIISNIEHHTTSTSSTGEDADKSESSDGVKIDQGSTDSPSAVDRATTSGSPSWSPSSSGKSSGAADKLHIEVAPDGSAIWMSDIEEKDENSSSGASRANSEEPPEMALTVFDTTNSLAPHHSAVFFMKKGRSRSPGKGFSESLGLERLLPVGSATKQDDFHMEESLCEIPANEEENCIAPDTSYEEESEEKCIHQQELFLDKTDSQNTTTNFNMGAGNTELNSHVISGAHNPSPLKMANHKCVKDSILSELGQSSLNETSDKKLRILSNKLIRNRPISRSERELKATSSPDFESSQCEVGKSVQNVIRPWSQVYDDLEASELLHRSSSSSGSIQILKSYSDGSSFLSSEEQSPLPDTFSPRSNSLHTPSSRFSSADSVLQKFRKSFSLRFQRSRKCNSPSRQNTATNAKCNLSEDALDYASSGDSSKDSSFQDNHLHSSESLVQLQKTDSAGSGMKKDEEVSGFRIGSLLLRSSKERKKGVAIKDGTASKCNSADSGIQVEVPYTENEDNAELPLGPESPAVVRRRTASASESSPKAKPPNRPHSDSSGSSGGNMSLMEAFMNQLSRQKECEAVVRRNSDSGQPGSLRKTPSVERQLSTPSFIKMRTERSRPQTRHSKGRVCLRRSISQPLDLEKLGLLHKATNMHQENDASQEGSTASSDDEYSSEGEGYQNRVTSRGQPLFRELSDDGVTYAEALWDHVTIDPEELAFQAGEVIEVTDSSDKDWWWGSIGNSSGWFPAAFVRLRVNQEDTVEDCINKMADGTLTHQAPRKMSVSLLSNEQVRANVVQEIVSTERDFVQHLRDVVEGYLRQVRRRSDMFSEERIATIFGNIEQIFRFQSSFLKKLESCIDHERPHISQIGNCFLEHKEEFEIYSEYCNNHPLAVSELQELYAESKYLHFFEACRLLREMIDISLDGFLLTPVQKICKYPLQLAELLKYTKADHPDHQPVADALAAMREVAQLVNERKRRMECLERLAEWQRTIDNWEGPELLDTSSLLIYSGEVTRASSAWSRDLHMFLFDHTLIYCKKDLLKRNNFVYKGRINMDTSHVVDVEDGRDTQLNVTAKNAWKLYSAPREKWFLFYTKTPAEKEQWLQAFAEERQKVHEDEEQGFVVTEEAKKAARLAMMNKLKPKRPRAKLPKGPRPHPDTAVAELLLDPPCPKTRSGSLPSNLNPSLVVAAGARHGPPKKKGSGWFHFGSSKKPKK